MTIGELFVIEAEAVQHRRVQVVDAGAVLDRAEAELIRRAIRRFRL